MLARYTTTSLAEGIDDHGGTASNTERERLIFALVRRYLLLAQVRPAEWSRSEAALALLGESLLER